MYQPTYKYPKPTEMEEGRNEEKRKNGRKKEIRMKSMISFGVVVQSRVFRSSRKSFFFFFFFFYILNLFIKNWNQFVYVL